MSKITERFSSTLLVEGNDDQHVVWAICQKFGIAKTFDVFDCDRIDNVVKQLPVRIKLREPRLGILIDADTDLQVRWKQLQDILNPLGYVMPDVPNVSGSLIKSETADTVIGIWIMPNNQIPGMLEDFAGLLIPIGDNVLPYVTKAITEIQDVLVAKFKPIHRSKALIHTWLAWQENPGTPMGLAITKTYLDHNHGLCVLFVDWLNRLFNPAGHNQNL